MKLYTYRIEAGETKAKLIHSSDTTLERGIKMLDHKQTDWSRNIMTEKELAHVYGSFDPNNALSVERRSQTELYVVTTGKARLKFEVR